MREQSWVSVDERWPAHLSDVLVAYKCGKYIRLGVGEFDGTTVNDEGMTIPYFKGIGGFEVSHWMALPEPPAGADEVVSNARDHLRRGENMDNTNETAEPSGASGGYAREWRVAKKWCNTLNEWRHFLIHPCGFDDSSFEDSPMGRSQAHGWADTYNMNSDKAAEFRECPYCKDGCPWCA